MSYEQHNANFRVEALVRFGCHKRFDCMNVLVIGSGAREHAIAWKLASSYQVDSVVVNPGNAGTASVAVNARFQRYSHENILDCVREHKIDLTIVGPETTLADGIVDRFQQLGLPILGPTKDAARIETSKVYAKSLMASLGVPTAEFRIFDSYDKGRVFLEGHKGSVVIKADGLAAGKGVVVCHDTKQALTALQNCMEYRIFGAAGEHVVVEEYLQGQEVSVFGFVDGEHLSSIIPACDYKRLLDDDDGPNTGGMGSYHAPYFWTPQLADRIRTEILEPIVRGLAERGSPYKGVLYAGLMITAEGPKVVEFNCRLGDPEAQVILPLLNTDLVEISEACIGGSLNKIVVDWAPKNCMGVVMVSGGYPGHYLNGLPISGLSDLDDDILLFHGATQLVSNEFGEHVATNGGRVLTLVGMGGPLQALKEKVYRNVERIGFEGIYYRKDIAEIKGGEVM